MEHEYICLLLTIEELNDIGEVHAVGQYNISIDFEQSQCQEEHKTAGGDVLGRPDGLPREEDIVVDELALKVEQEPAVAEIEVCVVSALVHHVVHLRVEDLDERAVNGITMIWRA